MVKSDRNKTPDSHVSQCGRCTKIATLLWGCMRRSFLWRRKQTDGPGGEESSLFLDFLVPPPKHCSLFTLDICSESRTSGWMYEAIQGAVSEQVIYSLHPIISRNMPAAEESLTDTPIKYILTQCRSVCLFTSQRCVVVRMMQ